MLVILSENELNLDEFNHYDATIKNIEDRRVEANFIGEREYGRFLQRARDSVSGHHSGARWRNIIEVLDRAAARLADRADKPLFSVRTPDGSSLESDRSGAAESGRDALRPSAACGIDAAVRQA